MDNQLHKTIFHVANSHGLYSANAYYFILDALRVTSKRMQKENPSHSRHLSGGELAIGIKEYALKRFGCMSYTVMTLWGINKTADFGAIVYHLIDVGLLGKSGDDSIDDFRDIFDFEEAFLKPYKA
ncbi:MAG: hypothetical protein R6V06_05065 [Kiritimatiellia bacterium]